MNNYSVKKLTTNDWQEYRAIRLEALAAHPNFFSPSRDETQLTETDWKQRLSNQNAASFGLYAEGELIGLTGIFRDHTELKTAHLVSSYIKPKFRKKGLSRLLYEERIKWAKAQKDVQILLVDHNEENEPSMKAHQKFGFKFFKSYEETTLAGLVKKVLSYKLEI